MSGLRWLVGLMVVVGVSGIAGTAWAERLPWPIEAQRVAGADRVETAVEVSRALAPESATVVVLARADEYVDALVAGPLAARLGAPVLLTPPDGLAAPVVEELRRLGPDRVVLVGGETALSSQVADDVAALGVDSTERLSGVDRYETALAVLAESGMVEGRVWVAAGAPSAHGGAGWPDALAAGAAAAIDGSGLLVVPPDEVPDALLDAFVEAGVRRVDLAGGEAALSARVARDFSSRGLVVRREAGATRYDTAFDVASHANANRGGQPTSFTLVSGEDWPDALAATPLVASDPGGILLLVTGESLAEDEGLRIAFYVWGREGAVRHVRLVGGTQRLGVELFGEMREGPIACPEEQLRYGGGREGATGRFVYPSALRYSGDSFCFLGARFTGSLRREGRLYEEVRNNPFSLDRYAILRPRDPSKADDGLTVVFAYGNQCEEIDGVALRVEVLGSLHERNAGKPPCSVPDEPPSFGRL